MDYTPEQLQEIFNMSKMWANIIIGVLVTLLVLGIIDSYLTTRAKKKYYKELTTEEQHCIEKYNNVTWINKKDKK